MGLQHSFNKKKRRKFVYQRRTYEDVKRHSERSGSGAFDSIVKPGLDVWYPKHSSSLVRFLPPTWDGAKHFGYKIWVHAFVGSKKSTYLCPEKMLKKKCPFCIRSRIEKKRGNDDEAKDLAAKEQVAYWILDRDADKPTPKLYRISWMQDIDLTNQCISDRSGALLSIDDPVHGFDVTIKKTGQRELTRYSYVIDREESKVSDSRRTQERIEDFLNEHPIPDALRFYDAKYLQECLEGTANEDEDEDEDYEDRPRGRGKSRSDDDDDEPEDEDEEDEDEEEEEDEDEDEDEEDEPAPRRGRASSKRKSSKDEDEDEEDEDEDEDEEDEDEEDEKPAPRRGRGSSKRKPSKDEDEDEDEEDEDEDEDEEEDEPAPRRGRGKKVVEEEEEDEEEDEEDEDEEEEEDEKPAPRRKPATKKKPVKPTPAKKKKPAAAKKKVPAKRSSRS